MTTEEWRPIPGHPGYEASDQGRIRSWVPRHLHPPRTEPLLLNPTSRDHEGSHLVVTLAGKNRRYVHRLIALTFLGRCPEGQMVRHLNDVPTDNRLANLAYGDMRQNQADAFRNGRRVRATECAKGHPFDEQNTYVYPATGLRSCRECARTYSRAYKARKRAESAAPKAVA